jgi:sigma-B regulation protein RsbU (phosphoserine phosphatase)
MFIPCDHCLRKHATHFSPINDEGQPEQLRLCKDCHEKWKRTSSLPSSLPADRPKSELEIAEELIRHLIPEAVPRIPGYDLSAYYRPSRDVGGDFYAFIELDADHLGLLVADVSGQGVPAAIVMTEFRALLKSESRGALSPAETFARVNRILCRDIPRGMFVTSFYAVLSHKAGTMTCVSAGHQPMAAWDRASQSFRLVDPHGIALGIDPGALFERTLREETVRLSRGDRFVLYTDGLVEAMNQDLLHSHLTRMAEESSGDFLSLLMKEVDRHIGSGPKRQDIAILTGRVV